MTSVVGEMMTTQLRKVKIKRQVRRAKRKTVKEEMKQDNVQSLDHGLVHHHTNIQGMTIQILGKGVFMRIDISPSNHFMSWPGD